jgi:hypothetical protein
MTAHHKGGDMKFQNKETGPGFTAYLGDFDDHDLPHNIEKIVVTPTQVRLHISTLPCTHEAIGRATDDRDAVISKLAKAGIASSLVENDALVLHNAKKDVEQALVGVLGIPGGGEIARRAEEVLQGPSMLSNSRR